MKGDKMEDNKFLDGVLAQVSNLEFADAVKLLEATLEAVTAKAEDCERTLNVQFPAPDEFGKTYTLTYVPSQQWESSGSCEWEESGESISSELSVDYDYN